MSYTDVAEDFVFYYDMFKDAHNTLNKLNAKSIYENNDKIDARISVEYAAKNLIQTLQKISEFPKL